MLARFAAAEAVGATAFVGVVAAFETGAARGTGMASAGTLMCPADSA